MKKTLILFIITTALAVSSCISTRNTIKNIDNTLAGPALNEVLNCFILTKTATSKKYAFTENYPVNVGYTSLEDGENNEKRFLNALAGPNGEKIEYKLIESCCPFPTNRADIGAGMLTVYQITFKNQQKPILLYLNRYERGELLIPVGLTAKKE